MADDSWEIPVEAALRRLQAEYGAAWMIWYVPCFDGNKGYITWCAKRFSDSARLHATQPGHLAGYIEAAKAEAD